MHALRTAIFTVKGLKRFMKDGYEHHAKSFDPTCAPPPPLLFPPPCGVRGTFVRRGQLTRCRAVPRMRAAATWKWTCAARAQS